MTDWTDIRIIQIYMYVLYAQDLSGKGPNYENINKI